jgi:hypothetical protein
MSRAPIRQFTQTEGKISMSESQAVHFPQVQKFIDFCQHTTLRYLDFTRALVLGYDYIEVGSLRLPIDQSMMRALEPGPVVPEHDRSPYWRAIHIVGHAMQAGRDSSLPYSSMPNRKQIEGYALGWLSLDQRNALKDEILAAKKLGLYPCVLEGVENFQPVVQQEEGSPLFEFALPLPLPSPEESA